MTPARLRECLTILHWPTFAFAEILGLEQKQVMDWFTGSEPTPEPVADWLEAMVAKLAERPALETDPVDR
ncbi:hypothetical protein [Devosia sp. A369]